jgi:hypothetical protein
MGRLTKRDIVAYDNYLKGKAHTRIEKEELDIEEVIKEFNEKWSTYAAIKNH